MVGKSLAAGIDHWHSYTVRFCFDSAVDQDQLVAQIEAQFSTLHGANLNELFGDDTSDEWLARFFLVRSNAQRVILTNDGHRGAEVSR